jgi:hypothetical protein
MIGIKTTHPKRLATGYGKLRIDAYRRERKDGRGGFGRGRSPGKNGGFGSPPGGDSHQKQIDPTKDDLKYKDERSEEKTVAVYMSIRFGEHVTFDDESQPEIGDWVYMVDELPGGGIYIVTGGVKLRFIDRK